MEYITILESESGTVIIRPFNQKGDKNAEDIVREVAASEGISKFDNVEWIVCPNLDIKL